MIFFTPEEVYDQRVQAKLPILKKPSRINWKALNWVGGEGFEPSKSCDNRVTVCPIWPLWYPPFCWAFNLSKYLLNKKPFRVNWKALKDWVAKIQIQNHFHNDLCRISALSQIKKSPESVIYLISWCLKKMVPGYFSIPDHHNLLYKNWQACLPVFTQ